MSKLPLLFTYALSFFIFLNFSSPFIFWIFTELNLVVFVCMMVSYSFFKYKQEMKDLLLFYFIIQSISSLFLLGSFFLASDFFIFNSDFLFLISMVLKLGIFPFFYWIFKMSELCNFFILILLLTLQKVPFFMFLFNNQNFGNLIAVLASFLSGSLMILFSGSLSNMLVCSSISYSFWIYYIYCYSISFFLLFFFVYFLVVSLMLNIYSCYFNKLCFNYSFLVILFMFFLGLSPMSLFFFKFLSSSLILDGFNFTEMLLFWILSFISLFGYMKFFYHSLFSHLDLYNLNSVQMLFKNAFLFFSSLIFFSFLIY